MKRIKELGINIYEIRDLEGEAFNKAIEDFTNECVFLSGEETVSSFTREQLVETIDGNQYFYDSNGNHVSIDAYITDDNEEMYILYLTEDLYTKVTLEDIKGEM